MTSSEKILAGIIDEAKKKADEITAKAKLDAEKIVSEAVVSAEKKAEAVIAEARKKAAVTESTGKSSAALLKRDAALKKRRELIEKVLESTVSEINALEDEKYFDYLLMLVAKGALPQSGKLLLSSRDLSRNTSDFVSKLSGYNLTLGDTPADIDGGFILKYNDILINCELKALLREKREQLVDSVNTVLFS